MKKKLISIIAVSAALATAGSALVACGGDGDNHVVKTDVTKEQWVAALSLSSFESNFKVSTSSVNEDEKVKEDCMLAVGTQKYGDYSLICTKSTLQDVKQRENSYIRIIGNEKDAYYDRRSKIKEVEGSDAEWKEGEWTVEYEDHETFDDDAWIRLVKEVYLHYTFMFADKYDSFEYKNGAYVLKGDSGLVIYQSASEPDPDSNFAFSSTKTASDVVIKFADGKLDCAEFVLTDRDEMTHNGNTDVSEDTCKMTYKISYGTQIISAPAGATGDNDKPDTQVSTIVTAEQWASALAVDSFTSNIKIKAERISFDGSEHSDIITKLDEETTFTVGSEKFGSYSVVMTAFNDDHEKKFEQEMITIVGAENDIQYTRYSDLNEETGKWTEEEWESYESEHSTVGLTEWARLLDNMELSTYVFYFADKYGSFKYEEGKYVYTGDDIVVEEQDPSYDSPLQKHTITEITFEFADGKISSLSVKAREDYVMPDGEEGTKRWLDIDLTYTFTYGVQSVTSPVNA